MSSVIAADVSTAEPTLRDPNPVLLWETIHAYQRTAALSAGVSLDLFTAIGAGADTVPRLAAHCKASERGIRILSDYLTLIGFLQKQEGRYSLTPTSAAFLDRTSPAYMGKTLGFLNLPELVNGFSDLTKVVREGKTSLAGNGIVDADDPIWIQFAHNMVGMIGPTADFIGELVAQRVAGPIKVLDLAAGHGLFGISVARRNPQARVVALDWPDVLEIAQGNARAAGVGDRHQLLPGDAFAIDFDGPYDVVLMTNLLHHFDRSACEKLISKSYRALKPGGFMVTLEFIPNEDRVSPPIPASFSLIMLAFTPSGDAYTFSELDGMLSKAGFRENQLMGLPKAPQSLVISRK